MKPAMCPTCGRLHEVSNKTYAMFGYDTECMPCINAAHKRFMRTTGKKLKMTCVENCPCGCGVKK